eukprot:TRINITY_DN40196_c0_g1_i1.p1 TRINITY_DN40196_c0_g1~~TRINITY_DN40196_c0_g1_i1.p1  ORF type:complete len:214 (-),score=12.53 TRINITY_DN40196_c0_g1_i1:148-732(-)
MAWRICFFLLHQQLLFDAFVRTAVGYRKRDQFVEANELEDLRNVGELDTSDRLHANISYGKARTAARTAARDAENHVSDQLKRQSVVETSSHGTLHRSMEDASGSQRSRARSQSTLQNFVSRSASVVRDRIGWVRRRHAYHSPNFFRILVVMLITGLSVWLLCYCLQSAPPDEPANVDVAQSKTAGEDPTLESH